MREIKFRAWNTEINKMCDSENLESLLREEYNNGIAAAHVNMPQIPEWEEQYSHLVWMQFTGLHDRNGKEIYEGDIVDFHDGRNVHQIAEIKFNDGCFDIQNKIFRNYLKIFTVNYAVEVIGNIYENSELLEKG